MKDSLTIGYLVEAVGEHMELAWVAGQAGSERRLVSATGSEAGENLVGPLNFIHPNRVQLIGRAELDYLAGSTAAQTAMAENYVGLPFEPSS